MRNTENNYVSEITGSYSNAFKKEIKATQKSNYDVAITDLKNAVFKGYITAETFIFFNEAYGEIILKKIRELEIPTNPPKVIPLFKV